MADKNVQLQSQTNDNLYPKTKAEVVMVTDTEKLSDKIDTMDVSIAQAQQTADDANATAESVQSEIEAARTDTSDNPQTHSTLKAHFDKIWTQLKTAATNATNALTTANEAKVEAEAATSLAGSAETVANSAQVKAEQVEAKADANTTEINAIKTTLQSTIKYQEI